MKRKLLPVFLSFALLANGSLTAFATDSSVDTVTESDAQTTVSEDQENPEETTQEEVSEVTGLAPRYISQIERGFSSGSISTFIKLCDAYGITANHVLYTMTNNPDDCSSYNSISNYNELNKKNRFIVDSLIDILIKQQGKK